jgi:hypothetical protein
VRGIYEDSARRRQRSISHSGLPAEPSPSRLGHYGGEKIEGISIESESHTHNNHLDDQVALSRQYKLLREVDRLSILDQQSLLNLQRGKEKESTHATSSGQSRVNRSRVR